MNSSEPSPTGVVPRASPAPRRPRWRFALAFAALALPLALTWWAWSVASDRARREDHLCFKHQTARLEASLKHRLDNLRSSMRAASDLLAAGPVGPSQWQALVRGIDMERHVPGLRAVGFVAAAAGPAHGSPVVEYLVPAECDPAALGLQRPQSLDAIARASDSAALACSSAFALNDKPDAPMAVAIFHPVYRRTELLGWVAASVQLPDLFCAALEPERRGLEAEILDGAICLYRTSSRHRDDAIFTSTLGVKLGGRDWVLRIAAPPGFGVQRVTEPADILLSGSIASLLLFGALAGWSLTRARTTAEAGLRDSEERFRLLVEGVEDHAIFMLDPVGHIVSWNAGAQRITGYAADEIIGDDLSRFYGEQDVSDGKPFQELQQAVRTGRFEAEDWRVRKDGSSFWAEIVITALRDATGALRGFCKITRDMTDRKQAEWLEADRRQVLEMVAQNQPLEEILQRLTGMVERQYPESQTAVLLWREGRAKALVGPNLTPALREVLAAQAPRLCAELTETRDEQPGLSPDDDPRWGTMCLAAQQHALRASLVVPIRSGGGQPLGAFVTFYRHMHRPQRAEVEVLQTVARLGAIAAEHRQLTDQLAHQAHHDPLTGLPNRVLLDDRLQTALSAARRNGRQAALLFIDLDRFKLINDTLGHQVGDTLLRQVSQRFCHATRDSDTLARMGGDEFTLVLPELADRQGAVRVAQKLLEALRPPFELVGHELFVTASVGVAVFPQDGHDAAELQKNADTAMYRAKKAGRNTVECFAPEMNATAMERLELEGHLRRALEQEEFELHYQPQVDRRGNVFGLEALLRWHHPKHGTISPAKFIPLAEDTGLILPIGAWVLREACRQARAWQQAGHRPVRIAVNVSALQFAQGDFAAGVLAVLESTGLEPRWLELEMTESLLMHDTHDANRKLSQIRAAGVRVAIDDFGTGYSSLAYLQRLPIDTLKIDGSFVREISGTDKDAAVVRAVASLAHSLGLKVLAEGVETEQQRDFLLRIGCDGMQGFLFSRPVPVAQIPPLLSSDLAAKALSA